MARIAAKKTPRKKSAVVIDDSIRKLFTATFNSAVSTVEEEVKEKIKFDRGEKDDIIDILSGGFGGSLLSVVESALIHEIYTRISEDDEPDDNQSSDDGDPVDD